jgi:hypothetical protein
LSGRRRAARPFGPTGRMQLMARDSGLQIPGRMPKIPGGASIGGEDVRVRAEAAPGSDENLGQGYLFSPPVPAAEIEGMVHHAA